VPFAATGTGAAGWEVALVEDITASFLLQVQSLVETVKQMDSALQRRSKLRTGPSAAGGAGAMSDSDKIALQITLDVKAYGAEISGLNISLQDVPSFAKLEAEAAAAAAASTTASDT